MKASSLQAKHNKRAYARIILDSMTSDLWSGEWLSRLVSSLEAVTFPQPLTRM
jgi:hypothetical protein